MEANNPVPAQLAAEVNGPEVGGEVLSAGADSRTLKLFDPHNHMTGGTVRPTHLASLSTHYYLSRCTFPAVSFHIAASHATDPFTLLSLLFPVAQLFGARCVCCDPIGNRYVPLDWCRHVSPWRVQANQTIAAGSCISHTHRNNGGEKLQGGGQVVTHSLYSSLSNNIGHSGAFTVGSSRSSSIYTSTSI